MEDFLKEDRLDLYGGANYGGGGNGNNNKGDGGGSGNYSGGGGNGPRKRLRREPRKILLTERKENSLGVLSAKQSVYEGNRRTY